VPETNDNRFTAGQTKTPDSQFTMVFSSELSSASVTFVVSRPDTGALAQTTISLTYIQAGQIRAGASRLDVTYNGTTVSAAVVPLNNQ